MRQRSEAPPRRSLKVLSGLASWSPMTAQETATDVRQVLPHALG